jgi:hypothetical protein
MFNWLFKKKEKGITAQSHIYMKRQHAWAALMQAAGGRPGAVVVYWFDDHGDQLAALAGDGGPQLVHYRQAASPEFRNRPLFFAGHYPFYNREQQLYRDLRLQQPEVYASLEDAVFQLFGGQRIASLMQALGVSENEAISHPMIAKSLVRAQKKAEAKAGGSESSARSEAEWVRMNFPEI